MKRFVLSSAILVAAGIVLAASTPGARADLNYPWCAQYGGGRDGARNCGFSSFAQCMATVSGIGGFCMPNNQYEPLKSSKRH